MSDLAQLYSSKELKALDAKKRAILKKRAVHHVRTSPDIRNIIKKHPHIRKKLRAKLRPLYKQLTK
jgi:hypothetical protein